MMSWPKTGEDLGESPADGERGPTVSRERAGRDIADQLAFRIANLGLGLVTTIVLVRALGDDQFGQWVTILAVMSLASSFGMRGLSNVTVERAAGRPDQSAFWVGALVSLRLALSPVVTFTSLVICLLVADSHTMRVAALILHTTVITTAIAASQIVFQLRVRNAFVSGIELVSGAAWALAVLLVAAIQPSLITMAIAFAIVMNATNLALWLAARRQHPIPVRGGRAGWRPLISRGLPVAIASVVTLGYGQIDQVLVFQIAGSAEAGLYGAAYRIYDRLHIFPAAIMATLFPLFVAARDVDRERVRKLFNTAIDYLVLASLPALTISLAGPDQICALLFGPDFAESGQALPILMAALIVISLGHLSGYLIISYSLQSTYIWVAVLALVFNVVANLALIPSYGFVAAAWTTLATELLVLTISLVLLSRKMRLRPTGVRLPRIVVAAVAAGLIAWLGRFAGAPTVVWATVGGLSYGPLLLVVRAIRPGDIRAVLARRRPSLPAAD